MLKRLLITSFLIAFLGSLTPGFCDPFGSPFGGGDVNVEDNAYDSSWQNDPDAASKGALYMKFESLPGGHNPFTITGDSLNTTDGSQAITMQGAGPTSVTVSGSTVTVTTTEEDTVVGNILGIPRGDGNGNIFQAVPGTDYLTPTGDGSGLINLSASQISGLAEELDDLIDVSGQGTAGYVLTDNGNGSYSFSAVQESRYHQSADINPNVIYSTAGGYVVLDNKTVDDLTLSELYVDLNEDPTTELSVTVYQRTAGIGISGTPTQVVTGTTSAGILTINSGWDDNTIPAGSKVWMVIHTDPDETTYHLSASLTGSYD